MMPLDMDLEPSTNFVPVPDRRPRLDEPPPVKLLAVEDVVLPAPAGLERKLDGFYAALLRFEREPADSPVYRAHNARLRFQVLEPPLVGRGYRPLQVIVPSLRELIERLIEHKVEFVHQRGVEPGSEVLIVLDPARNWVEVAEERPVM